MALLYIATGLAFLFSLIVDRGKTVEAAKVALRKFLHILPAFTGMLVLVSIVLFFISDEVILRVFQERGQAIGVLSAAALGSVALMPGFIAFPLCGILLNKGMSYMALSAFSSTLMMVGILSFPIERHYVGAKVAIIRNAISFCVAIFVAFITGLFFGEVGW